MRRLRTNLWNITHWATVTWEFLSIGNGLACRQASKQTGSRASVRAWATHDALLCLIESRQLSQDGVVVIRHCVLKYRSRILLWAADLEKGDLRAWVEEKGGVCCCAVYKVCYSSRVLGSHSSVVADSQRGRNW